MYPLDGPSLKLARAREHLDALDLEAAAFYNLNPRPARVTRYLDSKDGCYVFGMEVFAYPPVHLGLIVGDACHNMRASLDHLACLLVHLAGNAVNRDNGFPLYRKSNPGRFRRAIDGIPVEAVRAIENLQPYQGGDTQELLGILNELDGLDKHELIAAAAGDLTLRLPTGPAPGWSMRELDNGFEIRIPRAVVDAEIDFKPKPTAAIVFGDAQIKIRQLGEIHDAIRDDVFPRFTRFFPKC